MFVSTYGRRSRWRCAVALAMCHKGGLAMSERPEDENVAGWNGGFFFFGRQGSSDPSTHQFGGKDFYQRQW